jgi:quercetin dioxygenase-like cupin family protein
VRVIRQQPQSVPGPPEWFTGTVWFTDLAGGGRVSLGSVHFAPGARTAWHSHPQGQTLYVTEGVARVQDRSGPVEEVRAGQTVVTEAGVWHWHGAAPDQFMTHLAVYEGAPEWGDLVSDGEYLAGAED